MKQWKLVLVFVGSLLLTLGFKQGSLEAQAGIVRNTQFYNNPYLLGQPVLTRQDGFVAFNRGIGAPAQGVNTDQFTGRFSTRTYSTAGIYPFTTMADDAIQLIINNTNKVIRSFNQPRPRQTLTADVPPTAGQYTVQPDYREVIEYVYVYLNWSSVTGATAPIIIPTKPSAPSTYNWIAQYFNNPNLEDNSSAIQSDIRFFHNREIDA